MTDLSPQIKAARAIERLHTTCPADALAIERYVGALRAECARYRLRARAAAAHARSLSWSETGPGPIPANSNQQEPTKGAQR